MIIIRLPGTFKAQISVQPRQNLQGAKARMRVQFSGSQCHSARARKRSHERSSGCVVVRNRHVSERFGVVQLHMIREITWFPCAPENYDDGTTTLCYIMQNYYTSQKSTKYDDYTSNRLQFFVKQPIHRKQLLATDRWQVLQATKNTICDQNSRCET